MQYYSLAQFLNWQQVVTIILQFKDICIGLILSASLFPSFFGVKSEYRCGNSYEGMGSRSFPYS